MFIRFFFFLFVYNFDIFIDVLYVVRHCHHSFLYFFKHGFLLFFAHIYNGYFEDFIKSDILSLLLTISIVSYLCALYILVSLCAIFFCCCWEQDILGNFRFHNCDTDFIPHSLGHVSVVCLCVCLVTWLDYFNEVYFAHSVQSLVSLFRGHSLGQACSHSGMTVVLAELSLTVSLPDLSFKPHLVSHAGVRLS